VKIQRTIPPAAAPIDSNDLLHGLAGIILGQKYYKRLEGELKDYFGVKQVFLVSSGKAAFALILSALQSLSPGKKQVLIPAYTCFSVPSAIVKAGLEVSLCDINDETLDFDYELLEEAVNENTLCVVPNHLFGIPSDVNRIKSICERRGVYVVEDAAQAMGGKYKEKSLGTIGDVGFFSLGRGKNVTCGSGGIILTNSNTIAQEIEKTYILLDKPQLRETLVEFLNVTALAIFIRPFLYWFPSGLPFLKLGETLFYKNFPIKRLSGMKAGILHKWKKRLEESNDIRKKNAEYFRKLLCLNIHADLSISFLRLPLIVDNRKMRDNIYSLAQKKGLGISFMYPTSIDNIEEIHALFEGKAFPHARDIANRILTLPTHQLLSERDKRDISEFLRGFIPATNCRGNRGNLSVCIQSSN
jgi:dTDP-4-amino-4,6-dideoxygalactose transaminase